VTGTQQKLFKNVFSVAGQTVVQTLVLLVLYRYVLATIGVEKLGVWSIVLATASAARICELGLPGSVTKFIAQYRAVDNHLGAAQLLQTATITMCCIYAVALAFLYPVLHWALFHVLPEAEVESGREILPYALVSLWLSSVASLFMSALDACLRSDLRAGLAILASLLLCVVSLASVAEYGLMGLVFAQLVQALCLLLSGWIAVNVVMPQLPSIPVNWRLSRLRKLLGYGINFQINSVVMLLFEPVTKILLGRLGELTVAGYFELAQRIVSQIRSLIVASNSVIVPVFAGMKSDGSDRRELYVRNFQLMFFLATLLYTALISITPLISHIWLSEFNRSFCILAISLSLAWYCNTISAPAYFAYLGQGRLRWITLSHIVMGIVNIILGLLLGYFWGSRGILFAFCFSLLLGSLLIGTAYHRENRLRLAHVYSWQDVLLGGLSVGVAGVVIAVDVMMLNSDQALFSRIFVVSLCLCAMAIFALWLHPMRHHAIKLAQHYRAPS
jgi:O-antigen/teichoic acid export membrane protein